MAGGRRKRAAGLLATLGIGQSAQASSSKSAPKQKRVHRRYECYCVRYCGGYRNDLGHTAYFQHRAIAALDNAVGAVTGASKRRRKTSTGNIIEDTRSEDSAEVAQQATRKKYRVTVEDVPDEAGSGIDDWQSYPGSQEEDGHDNRSQAPSPGGSQHRDDFRTDYGGPQSPWNFWQQPGPSGSRTSSAGSAHADDPQASCAGSPRGSSGRARTPGAASEDQDPDAASLGSHGSRHGEPDGALEGEDNFVDQAEVKVTIADVKNALEFINLLKTASLDDSAHSGLSKKNVKRLRNPPRGVLEINDPLHLLSIDIYLGLGNSAEKAYTMVRAALMRHSPEQQLLSLHQVKQKIQQLSGIIPIVNDMCINSCIGYTGPHASKDLCPKCKQPRYMAPLDSSGKKVPRKTFSTIPLGQQLQALKRSPEGAESMEYLSKMVEEVLEELNTTGELKSFDDVSHGSRVWGAYAAGDIAPNDIVVMMSIDGAQLYRNKKSDCWIYIWVVLNLGPDKRYRKRYVLPGGVIPGPNHPQDLDSFLFPGFYHVSALMQEGLHVWDAFRDERQLVSIFVAMGLADGPAMALLAGTVGLTGRRGCRLYCPLTGRHKPRCGTYYPVLLKPEGYNVRGCMHDDVHPADLDVDPDKLAAEYLANLARLIEAPNQKEYERLRLETGLTKPSLFSGLSRCFALPGCFPLDFMHLALLNLTVLFFALWRGTIKGGKKTDPASFPWAVFADEDDPEINSFKDFGREVARACPWLPGCYDRPPRDLSEKINSGYKAQEWETLFYGYGPAMLRRWLPQKYWEHYCMLVRAARLLGLCSITADELCEAQDLADRMAIEFECLYCLRDPDLLHHCRPCVHAFTHGAREVKKTGPLPGHTQKPMERTIGNLGEEIKLPSNACANIAQRAILRCQKCAITALVPFLAEVFDKSYQLPDNGVDVGSGYALLRARERTPHHISDTEAAALERYLDELGFTLPLDSLTPLTLKVQRWARLRLPNGQIVRSRFAKAEQKPLHSIRIARIAKLIINGEAEIGEVLYYCRIPIREERESRTVAVVSLFGARNPELYSSSHKTVWLSKYLGDECISVVDVTCIQSIAAMVPDSDVKINIEDQNEPHYQVGADYFLVEKMGVEMSARYDVDAREGEGRET